MDTINGKGVQHLLVNVVVSLSMFGKVMSFPPKMWRIGEFCVGINGHDVTCQYGCRTDGFPITCWTLLQIETEIARWSAFTHAKY